MRTISTFVGGLAFVAILALPVSGAVNHKPAPAPAAQNAAHVPAPTVTIRPLPRPTCPPPINIVNKLRRLFIMCPQ